MRVKLCKMTTKSLAAEKGRMTVIIMQALASQLPFLANRNAELAVPPLLWPVNCIKIGGHVALLSGPTVYTLYCDYGLPKIHEENIRLLPRAQDHQLMNHPNI